MANIQSYLDKISGARYGKDVRSSIVNAIDAVNTESNSSVTKVNAAESRVNTAVSNANAATTAANTAATKANTAAANANEAAQAVLDEKYILTATTEMVRSGTARPTAKGNALLEKLTGDSWQGENPTPDTLQAIRSTGDMGWFDGEWLQGFYSGATYTNNANYICSKNKIPCKSGDVIKLVTESENNLTVNFYEGNTYLSRVMDESGVTELEGVAPSGATCFTFNVNKTGITPSTVGHVCATINGKYAAIVDEVGKNKLQSVAVSTVSKGITITVNDDKSITMKGTNNTTNDLWFDVGRVNCKKGIKYRATGAPSSSNTNTYCMYVNGGGERDTGNGFSMSFDKEIQKAIGIVVYANVTVNATFYPMVRACDENDNPIGNDTYTPYQSKRTYIPLDEPLRGIGDVKDEICYRDELYGGHRLNDEVVFDGSDDEAWIYSSTYKAFAITMSNAKIPDINETSYICSHLQPIPNHTTWENLTNWISNYNTMFYFFDNGMTTVDEWKAHLQANPITVQYELAEPVFTPFEDQTPFYNLQSFDEVTHVSIAGLHEELQPTITMRFPRHEDGALVTTAYCNGKKNEIRMDELTAAMLALSQS